MDARFVTAYHGTSSDRATVIQSKNFEARPRPGSWLGTGQYFFYRARGHAEAWAKSVAERPTPKAANAKPVLITCEIDLDNYINLLDRTHWENLQNIAKKINATKPQAGINALYEATGTDFRHYEDHDLIDAYVKSLSIIRPVSCVMAVFLEGKAVAPNSWLYDQSHVCISVINKRYIKIKNVEEVNI